MIISATTMDTFKTRVFSTWNERDRDLSVVDVIMASCAAPTFFPPVKPAGEERDYVDGGLWGNCPCLVAVTEARANKQAELEEIQMLEIGNGRFSQGALGSEFTRLRPISPKMINAVFEMMFAAQHAMAEDVLEKLGMDDKRILVLDTQTKEAIELDDVQRAVAVLPALAEEEVRKRSTEVKRFLGV
jgi:predicted acylesterase/phospholipase RssA